MTDGCGWEGVPLPPSQGASGSELCYSSQEILVQKMYGEHCHGTQLWTALTSHPSLECSIKLAAEGISFPFTLQLFHS